MIYWRNKPLWQGCITSWLNLVKFISDERKEDGESERKKERYGLIYEDSPRWTDCITRSSSMSLLKKYSGEVTLLKV